MGLGERIKQAREEKNLTQKDLSNKIGVSQGAIANYETNVSHPKPEILFKLFEILNVDANYLFQDEMKESNPPTREQILIEKYNQADGSIKVAVDKLLDMPE